MASKKNKKSSNEDFLFPWIKGGLCSRCKPYNECYNLLEMSEEEWIVLSEMINCLSISTKLESKKV